MKTKHNQRSESRLKYKNLIQYQEILEDGSYGTPISTQAYDISMRGVGLFISEEVKLKTKVLISCYISDHELISFVVSVVRIEMLGLLNEKKFKVGAELIEISDENKDRLKVFIQEADIFFLLDNIDLTNVMDIHFIAGTPVTIKKSGHLKTVGRALDQFTVRNLLLNLLDEERYAKFLVQKDVNFILTHKNIRLRINMHFQQGRIEAVCRLVTGKIPPLAQLGVPTVVERLIKSRNGGLIIISGRTGSGKTTTLASIVSYISKLRDGVIVCIEDPIEYIHEKGSCVIKQREVGDDTPSFEAAVRNALRQNPDVLVIGETLDKETLELLLTTAESGMTVLTTMHSASAPQAMDRIASFFPPETQKHILTRLSLVLRGIIVQNLFPRIMGDGGLVLASEVFLVNELAKKLIREGDWKQIPDIISRGRPQGMLSMKESIQSLVNRGIIDMGYLMEYTGESTT